MRDEYFTLSEICWIMGITSPNVHKIAREDKEFPMMTVGRRYVIPKDKFFAWYDKRERNPRWKNKRVDEERALWLKGK